jgi:hypothetical protein
MMISDERFELFSRAYKAWQAHTEALPLRRDRNLPKGAFELDLDHLIDYLRPVLAAASGRSTQFDYPKVAGEYLRDLNQIEAELHSASISNADRQDYAEYLAEFQQLLRSLGSLPVPLEGHLGFRKHSLQSFQFLIDEYGFEVAETSPITVRFTTDAMFVRLSYSPDCPMDTVLVGRRRIDEPLSGFILDDFAYVAGLGVQFDYGRFDLRTSAGIVELLQTAADLVLRHGKSVLKGDQEAFREFQAMADERERSYVEMMERQHSA